MQAAIKFSRVLIKILIKISVFVNIYLVFFTTRSKKYNNARSFWRFEFIKSDWINYRDVYTRAALIKKIPLRLLAWLVFIKIRAHTIHDIRNNRGAQTWCFWQRELMRLAAAIFKRQQRLCDVNIEPLSLSHFFIALLFSSSFRLYNAKLAMTRDYEREEKEPARVAFIIISVRLFRLRGKRTKLCRVHSIDHLIQYKRLKEKKKYCDKSFMYKNDVVNRLDVKNSSKRNWN